MIAKPVQRRNRGIQVKEWSLNDFRSVFVDVMFLGNQVPLLIMSLSGNNGPYAAAR